MKGARLSASGLAPTRSGLARPVWARRGALAHPPLFSRYKIPSPLAVSPSPSTSLPLFCRLLAPPSAGAPLFADHRRSPRLHPARGISSIAFARIGGPPPFPLALSGHAYPGPVTRAFDGTVPSRSLPSVSTTLPPLSSNGDEAILGRAEGLDALDSAFADHPFHHCSADL